jgi:DNA-binding NtrC family response regulator
MIQELRLVGSSTFAKRIVKQVARIGGGREDVLIVGETGSGRRTVAWEIHNAKGKKKPYVLIDARAMGTEEIRAIFTGHDPESAELMTGRKPITISDNATVTIADADLLAPHNQALVSSFLKEGRKKVAGLKVIVTVQQPLERLAQGGVFAADLAGHLEKFEMLEVPPLRDRVEDIPALTASITKQLCAMLGKPMKEIDANTSHILSQGQWPGNLQQLVGVLGKAVMISHGDTLELPPDFLDEHQHLADALANIHSGRIFILDQSLDLIEKLLIQRALKHFMYNQSRTAQVFGLSEANFRYRLKKFGLPSIRKKA